MSQTQSNADQIAYWNADAGQKWATAQERLDAMLAPVSAELIKAAAVRSGERVLDVGCGCGDTSIQLAKNGARVTGVDISQPMLARARARAAEAGVDNLEFAEADAAAHRFAEPFDLLFSRFGVMFFADPDAAFANMHKALKADGRVAFACWRDWRENEWVRVPVGAVRPHLPTQPPLAPEDPGPFAFADLARVRRILAAGGFDAITARPFDTTLRLGETHEDALAHIQDFGPVSRMMANASAAEKSKAVAALDQALRPFSQRKPLMLGAAVWIITAKA
jgi:SAM-dependent methyltransferase